MLPLCKHLPSHSLLFSRLSCHHSLWFKTHQRFIRPTKKHISTVAYRFDMISGSLCILNSACVIASQPAIMEYTCFLVAECRVPKGQKLAVLPHRNVCLCAHQHSCGLFYVFICIWRALRYFSFSSFLCSFISLWRTAQFLTEFFSYCGTWRSLMILCFLNFREIIISNIFNIPSLDKHSIYHRNYSEK